MASGMYTSYSCYWDLQTRDQGRHTILGIESAAVAVKMSLVNSKPDEHASKKLKHQFMFGVQCLLGGGSTRHAFSVVRDSRMWCPHDIGRDSWVWGEQETL